MFRKVVDFLGLILEARNCFLPGPPWNRRLGDAEGCCAVVCAILVFNIPRTVAYRFEIPWLWMNVWALGIGFGVGALRFGGPLARIAGGVSVAVLVRLIAVMAVNGYRV
jgi:hypothetical protein